jgi:NADPH:quinone reductase
VRAALCRTYGPPEVVGVEDVDSPELEEGRIRVRIAAAAVNFPDVLVVADRYQIHVPLPFVPGSEFAGQIVEMGEDVSRLAQGERVFGSTLVGAFAEEVVVGAGTLSRTPPSITDRTAAAFGVAHRTAYHVLRSVARIEAGEDLVVLGAGGGVGLAAVQVGDLLGAKVTAVASSSEKLSVAQSLGAAQGVNHRQSDLRQALRELLPDGAHVVVDTVGGRLSEPSLRALRWGGRFVTVGYASGEIPKIPLNLVLLKGVHLLGFQFRDFAMHQPQELYRNEKELMALLAAGKVSVHIGASFSLEQTAAALRHVADGNAIGKVVIDVSSRDSTKR